MRDFELSRDMVSMTGRFYPTGHILAMFPDADVAREAARALEQAGAGQDAIRFITPEVMMRDIVRTVGNSDLPLPSPGTEADTVRRFARYASQGHHALLIPAADNDDAETIMQSLRDHQVTHAQRYRMLVIEDLA